MNEMEKNICRMIGRNLRRMRLSRKLTLQNMEEVLELSAGSFSRYENGIYAVPYNVLMECCRFFHVDMNEITGFSDNGSELPMCSVTQEEMRMIEGFRRRGQVYQDVIRTLCFDGREYRTIQQEKRDAIQAAKKLLK